MSEHTLAELKRLNAGYHFTDINNQTPYRGHDKAKILSFEELLELYPNMYINVDLKDAPDTYEGRIAPKVIFDNIIKHGAQHRVLVTSFHKNKFNVSLSITKLTLLSVLVKPKLLKVFLNLMAC